MQKLSNTSAGLLKGLIGKRAQQTNDSSQQMRSVAQGDASTSSRSSAATTASPTTSKSNQLLSERKLTIENLEKDYRETQRLFSDLIEKLEDSLEKLTKFAPEASQDIQQKNLLLKDIRSNLDELQRTKGAFDDAVSWVSVKERTKGLSKKEVTVAQQKARESICASRNHDISSKVLAVDVCAREVNALTATKPSVT